jgi:hypothetical protein
MVIWPGRSTAADGARLSILSALDMTAKTSPVGVAENYMFTLEPALHGLDNPEAPSLAAVIAINGNSPSPSSWSRRKTALQPVHDEAPATQGTARLRLNQSRNGTGRSSRCCSAFEVVTSR